MGNRSNDRRLLFLFPLPHSPSPLFCGLVRSDSRAEDKKPLTGSCLRSSHGAAGSLRPRREEERGARAEVTRAARRGRGERRVRLDNCGGGSSSDRGAREESSGDRRGGSAERTAGAARGRQGGHEKVRGAMGERDARRRETERNWKVQQTSISELKKKKTLEHSSPSPSLFLSLSRRCMSSPAPASSSSSSDTSDASVLRSARRRCHAARDAYAACLDASGSPPTARGARGGLVVPQQCSRLREEFERACKKSWVSCLK